MNASSESYSPETIAQPSVSYKIPTYAFDPNDIWTRTFQRGLREAGLQGRSVYEVGIGTGANVVFMLKVCGVSKVIGSDLDPRLITLASDLIAKEVPDAAARFHGLPGSVNLLESDEARACARSVETVVGCLPQVGDPADAKCRAFVETAIPARPDADDSGPPDRIAHYYAWANFDAYPFNVVGLGLNEALLRQTREAAPQTDVILNFACRCGERAILDLFRASHYRPEILHSTICEQSRSTDISFYVALEKALEGTSMASDFRCEFFADPQGAKAMTAVEAYERQQATPEAPVYHRIIVVRGRPAPAG